MIIHVVQPGETIHFIAESYGLPASRIIIDNDLQDPSNLVPGQTIVIAYPELTHTVQKGDTLTSIADQYMVTVRELLRNNPDLVDRTELLPGETLIISYGEKRGTIATNGFAYSFIRRDILSKTLPYLTYLTVLNYQFTEDYQIIGEDDTEILQMAKEAGVIPLLQITNFADISMETIEATIRLLFSEEAQSVLIDRIVNLLKARGYYGLNTTFSYIDSYNYPLYNQYLRRLQQRLSEEGLLTFVTIAPRQILDVNKITIDRVDYSLIGRYADGVNLMNFDFSISFETPSQQTITFLGNEFINYAKNLIPADKIYDGLSVIAYDWPLPYEIGVTRANSLSTNTAIELARSTGSVISYDDIAEAAYFYYNLNVAGAIIGHVVWFKDARSIDTRANQVINNNFRGLSIWNLMYFYKQMWLILNSQYEIETLL